MGIEDFIGSPAKAEGGFFDPLKLSEGKDDETLRWYRAAELKHGRISMLATLGIVIQGLNTGIIPGFPVQDTNAFEALKQVYYKNPGALIQVRIYIQYRFLDNFIYLFGFTRLVLQFLQLKCYAHQSNPKVADLATLVGTLLTSSQRATSYSMKCKLRN